MADSKKRQENTISISSRKSTLYFKGKIKPGASISFDCKESGVEKGLPLKHIELHQIEYTRNVLGIGETSFILCYMRKYGRRFLISGRTIIEY